MLESIQKLLPWVTGLPIAPKVAVTVMWLLLSFVFLYMVWVPVAKVPADQKPEVRQAYARMERVFDRLKRQPDGQILVDGTPIERKLADHYYPHYIAIAEFLSKHPGDIKGAYEEVWTHGGSGRVYTSDTQAFEAVVSGFFNAYTAATGGG